MGQCRFQPDDARITEYLEPHPYRHDLSEGQLKERGVPVWAIIGALTADGDNVDQVARDYGVSSDAVDAARAFYCRHHALIDPRLAANRVS